MIVTNILGTIDKKININKQMIGLLDNYLSTVFDYKYITYKGEDLIWNENVKKHIPKDWQVYCLGELFSFVKGKIPAQLKDRHEDVYDSIYLTIDTINGGQELYCSSVNMPYSKGNVLMVMDGAASGDVYVGFDGVVGSTFCMLKTKQSFVSNTFLYQILRSYSTNYKKTNVGSTVPHANKDYIQSMQIALPKEIDTNYGDIRRNFFEKASSNEKFANLSTNAFAKSDLCVSSVTYWVSFSNNGILVFCVVCVANISMFKFAISSIVASKISAKSPLFD